MSSEALQLVGQSYLPYLVRGFESQISYFQRDGYRLQPSILRLMSNVNKNRSLLRYHLSAWRSQDKQIWYVYVVNELKRRLPKEERSISAPIFWRGYFIHSVLSARLSINTQNGVPFKEWEVLYPSIRSWSNKRLDHCLKPQVIYSPVMTNLHNLVANTITVEMLS